MTKTMQTLRCLALLLFCLSIAGAEAFAQKNTVPSDPTSSASENSPNFILVMCDDLGWGDVGFNGNEKIRTPHLDAMASNGLVLERFYAQAPVCSPTRVSVLTGRHHDRSGIRYANDGHLADAEWTLFEMLHAKGYATGHFGKWHLGTMTKDIKDSNRGGRKNEAYSPPWNHRVDVTFATEAKTPTFDPMWCPVKTGRSDAFDTKSSQGWNQILGAAPKKFYGTRYWTGNGAFVDPDSEDLLGDDSTIIMDQTIEFIDANRSRPFVAIVWLHAPHLPVVASKTDAAAYSAVTRRPFEQNYYGCVTALDRQIGRLRKTLRSMSLEKQTMLCFCSDNGPEGNEKSPGSAGPFRGRKRSLYEGGVRVPSIIEWPGLLPAGMRSGVATCTIDYLPTIAEIVGESLPTDRDFDGISLVPLAHGKMPSRPKPLGFHIRDRAAWHDGPWKAIRDGKDKPWELYHLFHDPGESSDLADRDPTRLQAMIAAYESWVNSVQSDTISKNRR